MAFQYRYDYSKLTDRQLVERVLAEPIDEDAAVYLLHDRYAPLLLKLYGLLDRGGTWYDDCMTELFIHLKGMDGSWHTLATFEWRCSFGFWLKGVAWNKFKEVLPKLIEKGSNMTSFDNSHPDNPAMQIPGEDGEDTILRRERKVMLLESIGKLKDEEQKFVILKRLEDYSSKEIAILLQQKWQQAGTVKYNNKNEVVAPDEHYVNVLVQRAKKMLRIIMSNHKTN